MDGRNIWRSVTAGMFLQLTRCALKSFDPKNGESKGLVRLCIVTIACYRTGSLCIKQVRMKRKAVMSSSRLIKAFLLISLSCVTGVTFAGARQNLTQNERKKPSDSAISYSLLDRVVSPMSFPEDRTQRFSVSQVQIRGNALISTTELLEELPAACAISVGQGDETADEIYDFRALNGIISNPGETRQVSLKTIQGLTKYILQAYQAKGYAGIYVYVPAEAVKGKGTLAGDILPVQVIEGKIAQVSVRRYDFDRNPQEKAFLKESALESWSPVRAGDIEGY